MPSFLDFFLDPILRAPTLGSMLMCLASSLIGAIAFVQRRSLLGEALSHAAYPGVVLGVLFAAVFFPEWEELLALSILIGAFFSACLGLWVIHKLQRSYRVSNDAALCLVLSLFFGLGILIASRLQFTHSLWYKQIQIFLYGQAATMTDVHIGIYAILGLVILFLLYLFYRPIQAISFDKYFTESIGVQVPIFESIISILLVLSIVVGIRSVGVVLMSGMLIAPAIAARQWTHKFSILLILAGAFAVCSGFLGNYLSLQIPIWFHLPNLSLPTGPMILLTASFFCFISLLFSPETGLISRCVRMISFRDRRYQENILKSFWKKGETPLTFREIANREAIPHWLMHFLLYRLTAQGWIVKTGKRTFQLTLDGHQRAARVVRLHRLWEVYLVDYLGQHAGKVHRSAEEMEHILSPELEKELSELLKDPKQDPHSQPIPSIKEIL